MSPRSGWLIRLLLGVPLLAACGGSSPTMTAADLGPGGGDGGAANCQPAMKYGGGEVARPAGSVTARIVDETGAPVSGQPLFLCGIDLCSPPGRTGADGSATISSNLSMKRPAFKFGDAISYGEFAIPLTQASTDFTTGNQVLATGKLAGKPGAALAAGSSATSGDVTLTIAGGTKVAIDTLAYAADQRQFHATRVPLANAGPILASATAGGAPVTFSLLYAVAPAGTTFCPPAQVTVALPADVAKLGFTPGTRVEFWIMTIDVGQRFAPYAGWAKASDGVVSSDGKSVSTTSGFLTLENFALRKAG